MAQPASEPLETRDLDLLAFERQWWQHPGAKEEAIRRQFGLTPTAYYQRLCELLDDPRAVGAEPLLVRRLQRQRDARRQSGTSRRLQA